MGSGGYSIPSIVEQDIVQFKKNTAKFILHVEKDTVGGDSMRINSGANITAS